MARTGDFTEKTKRVLAQRVSGFCCYNTCNRITFIAHSDPEKVTNLGEAAHITAASPGGPRYDPDMLEDERRSASNGIWMCREHAREIDADASPFSVETLLRWKEKREQQVARSRQFFLKATEAHWNAPTRNDFFTGRDELLMALEQRLSEDGKAAVTQTIVGLGGIGKTQLAVEFCHRNREHYPFGVFWADASSAENLKTSYFSFAVELKWIDPKTPLDDGAEAWLRGIRDTAGWLLVLDNADEPEKVEGLLPLSGQGHLVITTRHSDPDWGTDPLTVGILPLDEASAFLRARTRRHGEDFEELAEELGCLPLALEQAGSYLRHHKAVDVQTYLGGFRKKKIDFLEAKTEKNDRPLRGDYDHTVATTWSISFERLPDAAKEALQALAFLDPDSVPIEFFGACSHLGPGLAALDLTDPTVIPEEIVTPLSRYSLVHVIETQALSVHRLVQEVVLHDLGNAPENSLFQETFESVHKALDQCFPQDPKSPSLWKLGRVWMPHILQSLNIYQGLKEPPQWDPTSLWYRAGANAWASGSLNVAHTLFESELSVRRRVLGPEHSSTLMAMANLAISLRTLGDANAARALLEKTLEAMKRVLGPEHPSTLDAMANLAESFKVLGDAKAARALSEKTLEVMSRTLGPEHPSTLNTMANLAPVLKALGDAKAAHALQEETLKVMSRVLGPEHPDTLMTMANLASSLWALGDVKAARLLEEETLEVRRRILGPEHPDTLHSMHNLAHTLRSLKKFKAAQALAKETLMLHRKVLGPEHPFTLHCIHGLLCTLRDSPDTEVDPKLVEELLTGVRKLPEGTPVRMKAEETWGAG